MKVRTIAPAQWSRKKFAPTENQEKLLREVAYRYMEDQTVDVIVMRSEGAEGTFAKRDTAVDLLNTTLTEFGFTPNSTDYFAGNRQSLESWLIAKATDDIEYTGEPLPNKGIAYRFEREF